MTFNDLQIVNYCHPSCKPLQNIVRLPKEKAFELAYAMAEQNKNTTAFYRFADFENYYPERLKTDKLLFERFTELGGKPLQEHPLSFVLQGSDYLNEWFDCGTVTKVSLESIPSDCISFTYGDSQSVLKRCGDFNMMTKDMLIMAISDYNGTIEEFLIDVENRCRYIEAQIWNDDCLRI